MMTSPSSSRKEDVQNGGRSVSHGTHEAPSFEEVREAAIQKAIEKLEEMEVEDKKNKNEDKHNDNKTNGSANGHETAQDYYFDSYSHFGIHEEMLKDRVRTETYRNAIMKNKHLFKGKTVLDIGCGTGILCLFAAQAGAKKVYGIECASIAKHAKQIVKDNDFEGTVEIIRGKVEEIELPVDKVDIIVSEWMGYFLLYESMLDTVLFARDKWLVKGGIMMPDKGTLYFGCLEDQEYKLEKVHFWERVYGFNMSCIQEDVLNEPLVDCVEQKSVCSKYKSVLDVDLYTVKKEDLDFKATVTLPITKNDYCHAMVAYFTVEFSRCHKPIGFSTSPNCPYTHWKQTVFYLKDDLMVTKKSNVDVAVSCNRNAKNPRDLDIQLKVKYMGKEQHLKYFMR